MPFDEQNEILRNFPSTIKFSYERRTHKKVLSDLYVIVPKGKKYFVWITNRNRKNICFFVSNFTERGTEIAIYDYAHYNEEVLRNKSYIICFSDNLKKRINYATWVINGMDTYEKFNKRFKIIEIDDINDMVKKTDIKMAYGVGSVIIIFCFYAFTFYQQYVEFQIQTKHSIEQKISK